MNTITIGIELNHVVRNINKQILKYYNKEFNKDWDIEEMDTTDDALKLAKFNSKQEKYNFFYIDYSYELFGCAELVEKWLSVNITNWLSDIEDIEDKDIRVVFYSMNEANLTIQSTYFFLSKIGARVRKVLFPRNIDEVWDECDVVITANKEFLESDVPQDKKVVLINKPFNTEVKDKAYASYDSLNEVIQDKDFFDKIS